MASRTIQVDFVVGKTALVPHPELTKLQVMSSATGWQRTPSHEIPLVGGEEAVGHFRGAVSLPEGTEFRLMLINADPTNPGLAHRADAFWFSLDDYPLCSSGINNLA